MSPCRVSWFKRLLPMTHRDRARLAQLDHTQAGMAMVADMLREISARQDAYAHAIQQAARTSGGAMTETTVGSAQDVTLTYAADALVRSRGIAEELDRVTEKVEQLGAALREG